MFIMSSRLKSKLGGRSESRSGGIMDMKRWAGGEAVDEDPGSLRAGGVSRAAVVSGVLHGVGISKGFGKMLEFSAAVSWR